MRRNFLAACRACAWRVQGLWLLAFLACAALAPLSQAQTASPLTALDAAASRDLDAVDAAIRAAEATLQRHDLSDKELQDERDRAAPQAVALQTLLDRLRLRLGAVKARLDQLGPVPTGKVAPESPQVTKERAQQQSEYEAIDALVKRAKLLLVQAEQVNSWIAARQHAKFTHSLFERSQSLLNPDLWINLVAMTPHNFKVAAGAAGDCLKAVDGKLAAWRLPLFWIALILSLAVSWPFSVFTLQRLARTSDAARPGRLRKIIVAWWVACIIAGCPLLVLAAVAGLLKAFGLFDGANQAILFALARTVAYVGAAAGLASGYFAPGHANWRLVKLGDVKCRQARIAIVVVAGLVAASDLLLTLCEAIDADPAYQAALRGLAAFCVALAIIAALWHAGATDCDTDDVLGPRVTQSRDWYGILRILLWIAAVAIIVAAVAGFMRLASFLAGQIYWVGLVGFVAVMLYTLIAEALAAGCKPTAPFGRALTASVGLRPGSIEQLAILLNGAATVTIFIAALLIVLAPWGVQSSDLPTYLRAAFFGFRVGDISVSLASLGVAIFILIAGIMATHAVERWLDVKFLPHTQLDIGLRNAIKTSFGYLGFIVALGFACAYLGLNFEKLAIVAGALSVGIGFGLQSIVNNFVSGLILLWERAIRVGDWIVVGNDEGVVSRINVRATEIATFDRAAVIVPNSNLITGVVKNFVRTDRSGRIQISVPVNLAADPETARDLLLDVAKSHKLVLENPAPQVVFTGITASAFNFDLFCFIGDVATLGSVKSDLNFEIYRRFKTAGLFAAPPPASVVTLAGLEKFEPLVNKVAALAQSEGLGNGKARD